VTAVGQHIVDQLLALDQASGQKHSSQIHSIINQVVMLDADDQGAWEQAQTANRQLDEYEQAIRAQLRR
jgi:hypothetical protein